MRLRRALPAIRAVCRCTLRNFDEVLHEVGGMYSNNSTKPLFYHTPTRYMHTQVQPKHVSMPIVRQMQSLLSMHPIYRNVTNSRTMKLYMQNNFYSIYATVTLLKQGKQNDTDDSLDACLKEYVKLMKDVGVDTKPMTTFMNKITCGESLEAALYSHEISSNVREYMLRVGGTKSSLHEALAASIYTREEMNLDIVRLIAKELKRRGFKPETLSAFLIANEKLNNLIASANRMLDSACEDNANMLHEVEEVAMMALRSRAQLWNGVLEDIEHQPNYF